MHVIQDRFLKIQVAIILTLAMMSNYLRGRTEQLMHGQTGEMNKSFGALIFGVLLLVIGLALTTTVMSSAATAGSAAVAGSFTSATAISDLVPLTFTSAIAAIGVGLIGVAGAGLAGRGPLA